MKKLLFSLFFIFLFMIPGLADFKVDSVAVSAEVSAKGRAKVTNTIQLTFDTATEQVSIPLASGDVSQVSAGDYRFSVDKTDTTTDVIIKKSGGFVGTQTFLVSYTVPYSDDGDSQGDYFSLELLSSRWARPIGSCSFQVLMPAAFKAEPELTSGYYGVLSPEDCDLVTTDTSLSGALSGRMAYDSLTLSMTLPDQYFAVRSTKLPGISMTYLTLAMAAVLLLTMVYWRLRLRFPRPQSTPRLLTPEGIISCQLPMALDGSTCHIPALVLEWANLGYLSISLSKGGVVVLTRLMAMGSERSRREQALFSHIFGRRSRVAATPGRFSQEAQRFRSASRRSLYPVIFDPKGGNVSLVQLPCQLLLPIAVGSTVYHLLPEGAGFVLLALLAGFAAAPYSLVLHGGALGFAALGTVTLAAALSWAFSPVLLALSLVAGTLPEMLVALGACLFSAIATAPGPRRSSRGIDLMTQTRGCRTFYRRASWQRLQVFQGESARFFQSQLPYAVALGVDRRFARRFEHLPVPTPEWLRLGKTGLQSASSLQRQLRPILKQLQEAFR